MTHIVETNNWSQSLRDYPKPQTQKVKSKPTKTPASPKSLIASIYQSTLKDSMSLSAHCAQTPKFNNLFVDTNPIPPLPKPPSFLKFPDHVIESMTPPPPHRSPEPLPPSLPPAPSSFPQEVLDTISPQRQNAPSSRDRLMISNPAVAECLFGQHPALSKITAPPEMALDARIDWGRDARVCLPSGEHLIPYEFPNDWNTTHELNCLLPQEEEHLHLMGSHGRGPNPEYRAAAIEHANEAGVPIKKNTCSCIEGGNCRIFNGSDGKPKALVGWNSVLLTEMALDRKGEFNTPRFRHFAAEHAAKKKTPDLDSIRIARNLHYFKEDLRLEKLNPQKYPLPQKRDLAIQPTPDEIVRFRDKALELEARLIFAQRQIGHDLGLPDNRIAFLLQQEFHIDLSSFAGTGDAVFLHDPLETLVFLLTLRGKVRGQEALRLEECIQHAEAELPRLQKLQEKNKKAIEKIGCKPVMIPGNFQSSGTRVNFMNSVLLENALLTNGTVNRPLNLLFKAEFLARVAEACPNLEVLFAADQTNLLEDSLHYNKGGLHCMTFTSRVQERQELVFNESDELVPKDPTRGYKKTELVFNESGELVPKDSPKNDKLAELFVRNGQRY